MNEEIDDNTWKQFAAKLSSLEAEKMLRELISYVGDKLKSRVDETRTWKGGIAFFSKGREILTIDVIRKGLRIYFQPAAGALFSSDVDFGVERVNLWKSSYHRTSGKYRGMTAWISKEEHLEGIKRLIDKIPSVSKP